MTSARLIFVRHAEPSDDVRGRVYGRTDVELSERGLEHAGEIAASLASEAIAAIYASPLKRALETAAPLARMLGLDPVIVDDLRELDFGELEGLTVGQAAARYPAQAHWMTSPAGARFPGGESVFALGDRAGRAARGIADVHTGEAVAVFSHAVVIRAILADALSMPLDAIFRLDQSFGGLTVVEWFDEVPFVRAVNASRI
jgi:alpha-ribazole phosphatase/probable phosphoglycerate mutase